MSDSGKSTKNGRKVVLFVHMERVATEARETRFKQNSRSHIHEICLSSLIFRNLVAKLCFKLIMKWFMMTHSKRLNYLQHGVNVETVPIAHCWIKYVARIEQSYLTFFVTRFPDTAFVSMNFLSSTYLKKACYFQGT